jgi:hydrogenase maturation protease
MDAGGTVGTPRILVAGMGNIMRGDDAFGVKVAQRLSDRELPAAVHLTEVGISGVSMAQELLAGYDVFILIDAMDSGNEPGTITVNRAEVPSNSQYGTREIASFAADMHQTDPNRILILGKALGVLPELTIIVGCDPVGVTDLTTEMSDPVAAAVPRAADQVEELVDTILADPALLEDGPSGSDA